MSFGTTIGFLWSPKDAVAKIIKEWSATGCTSEKECEDSLYALLHERFPEIQIIRQYGRGRSRVDLMVAEKVMIELKYTLTSTSEYQRLVGQLIEYKDWHKDILLVLVGDTERSILKQLERTIETEFSGFTLLDNTIEIIQK